MGSNRVGGDMVGGCLGCDGDGLWLWREYNADGKKIEGGWRREENISSPLCLSILLQMLFNQQFVMTANEFVSGRCSAKFPC